MAFPIIPRLRSGAAGNPTTLNLGELAVNTATGKLYLGADAGVAEIGLPIAAGTTVDEYTGNGTTVSFPVTGYNGTADGGYLVSVGGIDQPPSKYSVSDTAGGTITFVEAPVAGELISIRAIVAGGGGGGSGDATSIQGVDVATTAPTNGQVLAYNSTTDKWQPTSLNGSVTFNTAGTHQWAIPAWARWLFVSAAAGDGSDGTATYGQPGEVGTSAFFDTPPTTGANGADGTATAGAAGKSITVSAVSISLAGGAAGLAGLPGYGGGGSGGGSSDAFGYPAANGAAGSFSEGGTNGYGGEGATSGSNNGAGGAAGGYANAGASGADGGAGGAGVTDGGNGGNGGITGFSTGNGGGGGGGSSRAGGGGGGGACMSGGGPAGNAGAPGAGGIADTSMCAGGAGEAFSGTVNFTSVAGTTIPIVISSGAGNASITITW